MVDATTNGDSPGNSKGNGGKSNGGKVNGGESNGGKSEGNKTGDDVWFKFILDKDSIKGSQVFTFIGLSFLVLAVLLFLYYMKGLLGRIFFSFDKLGDEFKQSTMYSLNMPGSDDYGLKRKDYIDFDYYIRTSDGSADCEINGKYDKDGLRYVEAYGTGDVCDNLNYEK